MIFDEKEAKARLGDLQTYCLQIGFGQPAHRIPDELLEVVPRVQKAQATTIETEGGTYETFEAPALGEVAAAVPDFSESELMAKWINIWDQAHASADMGVSMMIGATSDFASVGASSNGHKIGERIGAEFLKTSWGRKFVASPAFQDIELLMAVMAYGGQMRAQFVSIADQKRSGDAKPFGQKIDEIFEEEAA